MITAPGLSGAAFLHVGRRAEYRQIWRHPAHEQTDSRYNESHKEPLPVIPLHGLRHTSATLLIANNQDIRSVSARLGHAETSTTLNIYTHFLESTDKKSADILENVLVKHA